MKTRIALLLACATMQVAQALSPAFKERLKTMPEGVYSDNVEAFQEWSEKLSEFMQ